MAKRDRTRDPEVVAGGTDVNRFKHVDGAAEGETQDRGDGNDQLRGATGVARPGRGAPANGGRNGGNRGGTTRY